MLFQILQDNGTAGSGAYEAAQGCGVCAKGAPKGVKPPASSLGSRAASSCADDTLARGAVALRPASETPPSLLAAAHLCQALAEPVCTFSVSNANAGTAASADALGLMTTPLHCLGGKLCDIISAV